MVDAMKSVAHDPLPDPLIGTWVGRGCWRHGAVETSVKDCELGNRACPPFDEFYSLEFGTIVQRCKGFHRSDLTLDIGSNLHRLEQLWSAVNETVADSIDFI